MASRRISGAPFSVVDGYLMGADGCPIMLPDGTLKRAAEVVGTHPPVGATVRLHSLVGRADLNGTQGVVVSFDASKGRCGVKVDGEASALALKPANLEVVPAPLAPADVSDDAAGPPDVSGTPPASAEGALIEAVQRVWLSEPGLSAKAVHAKMVKEGASATLSEVKKACSKAAKRGGGSREGGGGAAATPPPADPLNDAANLVVESRPFHATTFEGRGRGLLASRSIAAGEVVLRELPTALHLGEHAEDTAADEAQHDLIAQMLLCAPKSTEHAAIDALCAFPERFDAAALDDVASAAVPAVRALVKARAGKKAAAAVTREAIVSAHCKLQLNGKTITNESLDTIGIGLYAQWAALLNHELEPNCWTLFEPVPAREGGSTRQLVLRALADIAMGDELTIAYVDAAHPLAALRAQLASRYFIPPHATVRAARALPCPSGRSALDEIERIGMAVGGVSFLRELQLLPTAAQTNDADAQLVAAAANAMERLQLGDPRPLQALQAQPGGVAALHRLERIALAHKELEGVLTDGADSAADGEDEPCALAPSVTRFLEASLARGPDWSAVHAACEQLLYLYAFCYPHTYPQRGLRLKLAGEAALQRGGQHVDAAIDRLSEAERVLRVSHGDDHALTRDVVATLQSARSVAVTRPTEIS